MAFAMLSRAHSESNQADQHQPLLSHRSPGASRAFRSCGPDRAWLGSGARTLRAAAARLASRLPLPRAVPGRHPVTRYRNALPWCIVRSVDTSTTARTISPRPGKHRERGREGFGLPWSGKKPARLPRHRPPPFPRSPLARQVTEWPPRPCFVLPEAMAPAPTADAVNTSGKCSDPRCAASPCRTADRGSRLGRPSAG